MSRCKAMQLLSQALGRSLELTSSYPFQRAATCAATSVAPAALQQQLWASSTSLHTSTAQNASQHVYLQHHIRSLATAAGDPPSAPDQNKRQALKCNTTAAGSPVSQAVACMVDRDVMPREQLCSRMEQLCQQLVQQAASFSSTELSAFAEACR